MRKALANGATVFVIGGEAKADHLWKWSIPATYLATGTKDYAELFRDANVVLMPDNDDDGYAQIDVVGAAPSGIAKRIRVLRLPDLPDQGDVVDWVEGGGTPERLPGQLHMKRVVAEMGGKNCMIVDGDADLDDVIPAALTSAFGFAGQKCSATSRLLVHERIATTLAERLEGALETLLVGPAWDFAIDVPAVIEADSRDRIEAAVAGAGAVSKALHRVHELPSSGGFYVAPTLVLEPAPTPRSPARRCSAPS